MSARLCEILARGSGCRTGDHLQDRVKPRRQCDAQVAQLELAPPPGRQERAAAGGQDRAVAGRQEHGSALDPRRRRRSERQPQEEREQPRAPVDERRV
jgi:hypothetical protein